MTGILHIFKKTADNLCYIPFHIQEDYNQYYGANLKGDPLIDKFVIHNPVTATRVCMEVEPVPQALVNVTSYEACGGMDHTNIKINHISLDVHHGSGAENDFTTDFYIRSNKDEGDNKLDFMFDSVDESNTHYYSIDHPSIEHFLKYVIATQKYTLESFLAQKEFLTNNPDVVPNGEPIKPYMYVLAKLGLDFLDKAQAQITSSANAGILASVDDSNAAAVSRNYLNQSKPTPTQ